MLLIQYITGTKWYSQEVNDKHFAMQRALGLYQKMLDDAWASMKEGHRQHAMLKYKVRKSELPAISKVYCRTQAGQPHLLAITDAMREHPETPEAIIVAKQMNWVSVVGMNKLLYICP